MGKPVAVNLDKNRRDNDAELADGQRQLNKLTREYVNRAVSSDQVILEQKRVIEELAQQLQKLSGRFDSIIDDNKSSTKAILEKATILVPNPEYPKDMFGQPLEA
jgi:hypothetical protein